MEEQLHFKQSSDALGENVSTKHMTPFMDHKGRKGILWTLSP